MELSSSLLHKENSRSIAGYFDDHPPDGRIRSVSSALDHLETKMNLQERDEVLLVKS